MNIPMRRLEYTLRGCRHHHTAQSFLKWLIVSVGIMLTCKKIARSITWKSSHSEDVCMSVCVDMAMRFKAVLLSNTNG